MWRQQIESVLYCILIRISLQYSVAIDVLQSVGTILQYFCLFSHRGLDASLTCLPTVMVFVNMKEVCYWSNCLLTVGVFFATRPVLLQPELPDAYTTQRSWRCICDFTLEQHGKVLADFSVLVFVLWTDQMLCTCCAWDLDALQQKRNFLTTTGARIRHFHADRRITAHTLIW